MDHKPTFTVFTPTYNRAHLLHRVYDSLRQQTFRDFEWLVVDDGSTDDTRAVVENWATEADFPIRYFWQVNQGKNTAQNLAVEHARGRFFIEFDDDDACVPSALERFDAYWRTIPPSQQETFAGIAVCMRYDDGALVGTPYPEPVLDASYAECVLRYGIKGEKWFALRTDLLRAHPFPTIPGKNIYFLEAIVWYAIGHTHKLRCVNDVLYIYYRGHSSMTWQKRRRAVDHIHIAPAQVLQYSQMLNDLLEYAPGNLRRFCMAAVHYARFSFHDRRSVAAQWRGLHNGTGRALWLMGLPLAGVYWARDRVMRRRWQRAGQLQRGRS